VSPFARVAWEREFEDDVEQAWAQSQSIAGSLPYAVPAARFDDSRGLLSFGARAQLWGLDVVGGLTQTVGQEDGSDTSLFLTLRGEL
jgi:outer membrane lipase/esterase